MSLSELFQYYTVIVLPVKKLYQDKTSPIATCTLSSPCGSLVERETSVLFVATFDKALEHSVLKRPKFFSLSS